jgi:hypothetical protein
MYYKSLEINEKLGRLEGMAIQYGNLGIVLKTRGDLDGAEKMYHKALLINEQLGQLEGMASDYGNLGNDKGASRRPFRGNVCCQTPAASAVGSVMPGLERPRENGIVET